MAWRKLMKVWTIEYASFSAWQIAEQLLVWAWWRAIWFSYGAAKSRGHIAADPFMWTSHFATIQDREQYEPDDGASYRPDDPNHH